VSNQTFTYGTLFVCCHFPTRYEWTILYLLFKDKITCLLLVVKFSTFSRKIWNYCENFLRKKWRKFISNTKYSQKIWKFHHRSIIQCQTSWYKPKLLYHFIIKKSTNHGYRPKIHIAIKYWNMRFLQIFQLDSKMQWISFISLVGFKFKKCHIYG